MTHAPPNSLARLGIGPTPRDEVHREDKLVLYRYRPLPDAPPGGGTPLLICYALVNRPYMLDLQTDRSLIRGLLRHGVDVYLLDWGTPDGADRFLGLTDYIDGYLARCVEHIRDARSIERINLLGVCQGGTFSLCYAARYPGTVRNLVTMVTPVDFHAGDNLLSRWVQPVDVAALVDATGNVPGDLLNFTFLSLMPFRLMAQKYAGLARLRRGDPAQLADFVRMEKWIFDSPDQAGTAFAQFVSWFYQQNRLKLGTLELGGRRVDLRRITMPVFNVYATRDHLVPPPASTALRELVGTKDYEEFAFPGGHIGIYVSARAQQELPARIADWLATRERAVQTTRQGAKKK